MDRYIIHTNSSAVVAVTNINDKIIETFPPKSYMIGENIPKLLDATYHLGNTKFINIKRIDSPKIIGFAGHLQSGKNTCGNYVFGKCMYELGFIDNFNINENGELICTINGIQHEVNPSTQDSDFIQYFEKGVWAFVKLYSFADPLKEFCVNVLGLSDNQAWGTNQDKSSLTNILWENMPCITQKDMINFADELSDDIYNDSIITKYIPNKIGKMTAREVMQYFGTNIVRRINPNAWINATIRKIRKDFPMLAVITDVRFPNEVKEIQKNGGKVIKLTRTHALNEHESEVLLDSMDDNEFDATIDNANMSIPEQNKEISSLLEKWNYNVWR